MEKNKTNDLEHKIIEAAKELFVVNGYAETSMSDIAARAGINRPTLHYYFRTKDRMFQAVFGSIVERLAPQLIDIVRQRNLSVAERVGMVVDVYYGVLKVNASLPLFILREVRRDFDFVLSFVTKLHFDVYFDGLRKEIQSQMDEGLIANVQMRYLFLTFYSLLAMPFTLKPICERTMLTDGETFDSLLEQWKQQIVGHVSRMLQP